MTDPITVIAHHHAGHTVLEPAGAGWQIRVVGGPDGGRILASFASVQAGRDFVTAHQIKNCRLVQADIKL